MAKRWPMRCLACLALALTPGCQPFYSYRPMPIVVRDAETGQPISGAIAHVSYPLVHPTQAPYDSVDKTVGDGIAHVQATPYGPAAVLLEVHAPGYMNEERTLSIESIAAIQPAGWFEHVDQRKPTVTVALYAEPRPSVELVLPVGFRGVIKAEIKTEANASMPPGLRHFSFSVPPNGNVELAGPPLMDRVAPVDYRARYVDGPEVSRDAKAMEVGFWGLTAEEHHLTFLVGTRDEFERARRALLASEYRQSRPSSSSKGGGRGRGGHKRGDGQSDPGQ
jgi:hypothetical protein